MKKLRLKTRNLTQTEQYVSFEDKYWNKLFFQPQEVVETQRVAEVDNKKTEMDVEDQPENYHTKLSCNKPKLNLHRARSRRKHSGRAKRRQRQKEKEKEKEKRVEPELEVERENKYESDTQDLEQTHCPESNTTTLAAEEVHKEMLNVICKLSEICATYQSDLDVNESKPKSIKNIPTV